MKRYALILTLALPLCSSALYADGDAVAGTSDTPTSMVSAPMPGLAASTPPALVRISDGFHIFDNASPFSAYDVSEGQWMAGLKTEVYKRFYISLDMGGIAPLHANTSLNFMTGARLNAGELAYDRIPQVKALVDSYGLREGLLKYGAGGLFVTRDWTVPHTSWGPYVGFEVKFPTH